MKIFVAIVLLAFRAAIIRGFAFTLSGLTPALGYTEILVGIQLYRVEAGNLAGKT